MTIILALCIPLTAVVVGFLTLKAVQLGLKWQIQTSKQEAPTLEIPNPIQPIIDAKQEKQAAAQQGKELQNILDEWVNGAEESR
ncbi:hypothetical protein QF028_004379 [Neobacillus sp. B4I6]|uniref:hypothetical protein n=1 Tax=Neobacillus sp. B4I6 TaxID=3373925 RepID=UPI003D1E8F20